MYPLLCWSYESTSHPVGQGNAHVMKLNRTVLLSVCIYAYIISWTTTERSDVVHNTPTHTQSIYYIYVCVICHYLN